MPRSKHQFHSTPSRVARFLILALAAGCATAPVEEPPDAGAPGLPLGAHFLGSPSDGVAVMAGSGWPLTLELTVAAEKRLGFWLSGRRFASAGEPGLLVLDYPDDCTPPGPPVDPLEPNPCAAVRFEPGLSQEADPGPSPRLPGLVITSTSGPSVVLGDDLEPTGECRNLASFVNSVAYELRNARGESRLQAHLNVPEGLFTPLLQVDPILEQGCVGDDGPGDHLVRVDGAAPACHSGFTCDLAPVADRVVVEVRAFLVDAAPERLTDSDGDGDCDAADASAQGLTVLSTEARMRFRQAHQDLYLAEADWVDLDGYPPEDGPPAPRPPCMQHGPPYGSLEDPPP